MNWKKGMVVWTVVWMVFFTLNAIMLFLSYLYENIISLLFFGFLFLGWILMLQIMIKLCLYIIEKEKEK